MDEFSQEPMSSLALRGGILLVLVVLFQYFVARAPNVQKETKRRFQHALTGHALVQISYVLPRSVSLVLLLIGSIGMYVAKTFFFEAFLEAFGGLLRPKELSGQVLPGAFYFLVGTAIVVLLTTRMEVARYAVECLALADPMASWVGSTIQSPKFTMTTSDGGTRTSSLSGCLACFGTALGVGWWMLEEDTNLEIIVAGAAACTIAEGLPFGNDNLNIPVITAFVVDRLYAVAR